MTPLHVYRMPPGAQASNGEPVPPTVVSEADYDSVAMRLRNLETVQQAALATSGTIKAAAGALGWSASRDDGPLEFLIGLARHCRDLEGDVATLGEGLKQCVAREVELSLALDAATSAHAVERAAADRLRGVLRQAAEAAGGCASPECSDEFLALLPGEVRALREHADQLERQAADRQAGADGWQAVYNRGRADGVKFRLSELEQERRIAAELQAVALRLIKTYITEDSKDEQRAIASLVRMRREVSQ